VRRRLSDNRYASGAPHRNVEGWLCWSHGGARVGERCGVKLQTTRPMSFAQSDAVADDAAPCPDEGAI